MPALTTDHEFLEDKPLHFELNLLKLENPSDWEGWILYEAKIFNGDELVVRTQEQATIVDSDIEALCGMLRGSSNFEFEAMELDFQITGRELSDSVVTLFIAIDEGTRRAKGYVGSGIGVKLSVHLQSLRVFADELRVQLTDIKNKH